MTHSMTSGRNEVVGTCSDPGLRRGAGGMRTSRERQPDDFLLFERV